MSHNSRSSARSSAEASPQAQPHASIVYPYTAQLGGGASGRQSWKALDMQKDTYVMYTKHCDRAEADIGRQVKRDFAKSSIAHVQSTKTNVISSMSSRSTDLLSKPIPHHAGVVKPTAELCLSLPCSRYEPATFGATSAQGRSLPRIHTEIRAARTRLAIIIRMGLSMTNRRIIVL